MSLNRKFVVTPEPARPEPIQYLTENGFSIIRRCDVDDSFPKDGVEHCFIVRDPDGYELEATVEIGADAVAEIVRRSRGRISLSSSYWIACAERHLAEYLWEHDDYPPDAGLTINQLTLNDMDLARRWGSDET
ncbi:MAG: hypothetical protein ACXWID_16715 [Pyrinomonadaceae bacterium]